MLIVRNTVSELALKHGITEEQVVESIDIAKKRLWKQRQERPKPHRDDKIVTSWNGGCGLQLYA